MKVNTELSHDAEYIGDIQENRVGIDKSNIDFITTILTSNLYSNPLESFLRETISNAYDSHVEAGTDEHILLLIQETGYKNYTISIRDYGVGISPERFEKIYRNIGSSTKRESNDYIGMFGIGRFSCLSCADVANITSYYKGKKYSYLMYKNGGGINIDKISEIEGDFKEGLEVSIRKFVSSWDIWRGSINHLCLFEKLHISYEGSDSYMRNLVTSFNNRTIVHFNNFSSCSLLPTNYNYFKVGNVLYDMKTEDYNKGLKTINGLIIDLPIGSVDITPNRESLQYTERTNEVISQKMSDVVRELQTIVNNNIKGDITLARFFELFCRLSYIVTNIQDRVLRINTEDIKIDTSSTTIGGTPIPAKYASFLKAIRYVEIDKSLICKKINKDRFSRGIDVSIQGLLSGNYVLVNKLDKVTKHITWLYLDSKTVKKSVILTYGALEKLKDSLVTHVVRTSSEFSDEDTVKQYVEFLFKSIPMDSVYNDMVPASFIASYNYNKNLKKNESSVSSEIPIRMYYSDGYTRGLLRDIKRGKGLIIYGAHVKDDTDLRNLAFVTSLNGVGSIITVKAEHLPALSNNRKFINIENFLFLRNKVLSKLVTAKIIQDNFRESFPSYSKHIPIIREFHIKYKSEIKCLDYNYNNQSLESIVSYYITKGWINHCDVQYFKLSLKDIQAYSLWDFMLTNSNNIIKNIVFRKFGKLPKIGLNPVSVPKFINKEKENESI